MLHSTHVAGERDDCDTPTATQTVPSLISEPDEPFPDDEHDDERDPLLHAAASSSVDGGVSMRFWLGFLCSVGALLHSGYFGGFTSPVLSTVCHASNTSNASSAVPCPDCLNCELGLSVQVPPPLTAISF